MRLFLAIDLPEANKQAFSELFSTKIRGCRWVPTDQIHLTLRFLGECPEDRLADLKENLRKIRYSGFTLQPEGVGCFPNPQSPRVLWIGLKAPPELLQLQKELETLIQGLGFAPETKDFAPHLTVGRFKHPPRVGLKEFLHQHAGFIGSPWRVENFILYSSELTPEGANHKREVIYPLSS